MATDPISVISVRGRRAAVALLSVAVLVFAVPTPGYAQKSSPKKITKQATKQAGKPSGKTSAAAKKKLATERLFKAVALNDMGEVKSNIKAGADLFAENAEGMTAADLAVDRGHFIVAHYLLSRRILGNGTPPVALVPGRTKQAARDAGAKPKRKFAAPRQKPPAAPTTPKAKSTPEPLVVGVPKPEPPPQETEVADASDSGDGIEEIPAEDATDTADAPGKPLAEEGIIGFFKRLVDLITPGGEKPPETPVKTADTEEPPETAPDAAALPETDTAEIMESVETVSEPDAPKDTAESIEALDESIIETVSEEPDEIVVEVTGDIEDKVADYVVEEITEDTPLTLVEADIETLTAESDAGAKPKKPEKPKSFLDRMASLFTTEDKTEDQQADAGAKSEGAVKPIDVEEYELPLPPPRLATPKKFSPKFLDKLADFMETGDEEAFKAWLPKMQVVNADALPQGDSRRDGAAPKAATEIAAAMPPVEKGAVAPAPDAAAMPPVEKLPLGDAPDGGRPKTKSKIGTKPTKGFFNRLVDVLTPDFGSRDRPERLALDPDEQLAELEKKEDGKPSEEDSGEQFPKYWPITEVETAEAPEVFVKRQRPPLLKTSLNGVTLSLGRSISLENSYPPAGNGIDPHNTCVKKNRGTTLFCLETIDWPETMKASFLVPTILYTGQKAIARYDQGIASRFHALFPTEAFKRIAQYFHERFGSPTDAWNRSIAPFAEPRQDNPTLAWRSLDPKTGVITVLEIRKFDDSRGGFPDTKRGAVMLYLANSPPIFPQVSPHELMRLSRGRLGPPPAPGATPPPSKEPPEALGEAVEAVEEAPDTQEGKKKKKSLKEMTAEEIQAERRKRKARESAKSESAPPDTLTGEDSFELPPDPLGR